MYKIFADINCPFCFAQHYRLEQLNLLEKGSIEWNYVEHAPALDSGANTAQQISQLKEECHIISQRAKEVKIIFPGFCVNTQLPILVLIEISQHKPELALRCRKALYQAYWQKGLDISSPKVLTNIFQHEFNISLPTDLRRAREIQNQSQQEWTDGKLDQRIPAAISSDNKILLGLQHSNNLASFFSSGEFTNIEVGEICKPILNQSIAFINCEDEKNSFQRACTSIAPISFIDVSELTNYHEISNIQAIVVNISGNKSPNFNKIQQLRNESNLDRNIPIIVVDEQRSVNHESLAFHYTASDYISRPVHSESIKARLLHHINMFQSHTRMNQCSYIDVLTGLYNKRMVDTRLEEHWRISCRNRTDLSIALVNIDNFKEYNNLYGHGIGDQCLQRIASIINKQLFRPSDLAGRYTGKLFLLILPDTNEAAAKRICKRIQTATQKENIMHERNSGIGLISLSFGISCCRPHADQTPHAFFDCAQAALTQAKNSGINQICCNELSEPIIKGISN